MDVEPRAIAQLREHYEIEKRLADRLRRASRAERARLYTVIYDELLQAVPQHPQWVPQQSAEHRKKVAFAQVRTIWAFLKEDTTFLDVGCGDGALACLVAQRVSRVYALDVSTQITGFCEKAPNLQVVLSDGCVLPFDDNSIDVAYSNQVTEHLHPEDAFDQMQDIRRVLVPGGAYICITPNRLAGPYDISRYFDPIATGLHLKEYLIAELALLFKSAGFRHVRAFASYQGVVLSPLLPIAPFVGVEAGLRQLPRRWSKSLSQMLIAAKLVAIK
jgi:ubiquinone/menaquinone biosynthesis C-methylase UbiE